MAQPGSDRQSLGTVRQVPGPVGGGPSPQALGSVLVSQRPLYQVSAAFRSQDRPVSAHPARAGGSGQNRMLWLELALGAVLGPGTLGWATAQCSVEKVVVAAPGITFQLFDGRQAAA